MPENAFSKLKSVDIYYKEGNGIWGFQFLDANKALIFKVGVSGESWMKVETVILKDNEVILGVVAKLFPGEQSRYTDF